MATPFGDPLRAIYLDTGVDDKEAVLALRRITNAANITEQALLDVAKASKMAGAGAGATVRSNAAAARSYQQAGTAARGYARDLFYLHRAQFQVARNVEVLAGGSTGASGAAAGILGMEQAYQAYLTRQGRVTALGRAADFALGGRMVTPAMSAQAAAARAGRGNYGLGTSLFLTGLGVGVGSYGYRQSAAFQRSSTLASFASGQTPAEMRSQTQAVRSEFRLRLMAASALTQSIAQLGELTPEGRRELARAGAGFNVLESTIGPNEAAESIYRLIKATSRSREEFDAGTRASMRYAGAIYAAGNESAAGAASVFAMVQEIEPLAQVMRLGANGTIALSAAFADLNENQRELFRGALTRMAFEGKLDPNNPVASLLAIAERLRGASSESEKINILKGLGFDNIRDIQTLSVLAASMDTFARALGAANEELEGTTTFGSKVQQVLADQQGAWDAFTSSLDSMAAKVVTVAAPALVTLLGLLTGIADAVAANPFLAGAAGVGGLALGGMALAGLYRHHFAGDPIPTVLARRGMSRGQHAAAAYALASTLPFGFGAERFATTTLGQRMAAGMGKGMTAGVGRSSRFSLGLLNALPFGERLAGAAAGRMAAGGIAGGALRLATGPVGWILLTLTLGAPLFERVAKAFGDIAQQGGVVGVVFNTLGLIFEVIAAGGRLLGEAFDWLGKGGKWLLDMVTFGHADEILGGTNKGLSEARNWVNTIGRDDSKAGAQSPPPAPSGAVVGIYTDGSRSGYQQAMDEVGRRSARSVPPNTYGGIPVA